MYNIPVNMILGQVTNTYIYTCIFKTVEGFCINVQMKKSKSFLFCVILCVQGWDGSKRKGRGGL